MSEIELNHLEEFACLGGQALLRIEVTSGTADIEIKLSDGSFKSLKTYNETDANTLPPHGQTYRMNFNGVSKAFLFRSS